jgi:hypothetical protein
MSGTAWMWLIIILLLTWVVPCSLFFGIRSKVDRSADEVWEGVPYKHLKFNKKSEMVIITIAVVGTTWLFWGAVATGLLVWK